MPIGISYELAIFISVLLILIASVLIALFFYVVLRTILQRTDFCDNDTVSVVTDDEITEDLSVVEIAA
jgi:hypothetical protein